MKYVCSKNYKILCKEDCYHVKNINDMFLNDKKWTTEEIVEECKNVIDQIVEKYCK